MVQQLEAPNAGAMMEKVRCLQFDGIHRYSSRWNWPFSGSCGRFPAGSKDAQA